MFFPPASEIFFHIHIKNNEHNVLCSVYIPDTVLTTLLHFILFNIEQVELLAPLYRPRNQSLERLINLFIFTQLVTGRNGICNYLMPYLTVNIAFYILQ